MIVMDTPRAVAFRQWRRSSHLASTLPGEGGTQELLRFARAIGLRERWIQYRGQPREHFDLLGSKIEEAAHRGATVLSHRAFVKATVIPKRAQQGTQQG